MDARIVPRTAFMIPGVAKYTISDCAANLTNYRIRH
jgi:hypothetical protein